MSKYKPKDGCRTVWMKVTLDEYELPLAIADTSVELAEILGVTSKTIYSSMSHAKHRWGTHKRTPYRKIRIELDDDDE